MDIEKMLTTEALRKVKPELSIFDFVSYAIHRAQDMIVKGRDSYVKTESQSRATQVLAEIANGKEYLDAFEEEEDEEDLRSMPLREFTDMSIIQASRTQENTPV